MIAATFSSAWRKTKVKIRMIRRAAASLPKPKMASAGLMCAWSTNMESVNNALVKLESNRTDGFFCESWDNTNDHGITVLPPIHMGTLKFIVKAKGFHKQEVEVPASSLGDPVRITLKSK
jgi:hypothetical protein